MFSLEFYTNVISQRASFNPRRCSFKNVVLASGSLQFPKTTLSGGLRSAGGKPWVLIATFSLARRLPKTTLSGGLRSAGGKPEVLA